MANKSEALLVIGTQRSGSNLLRLMLNQLAAIESPHPPHLLHVFTPLLPLYNNLQTDADFKQLVTDVVKFIKANPVPWSHVELHQDAIISRCKNKTLVELFKVVYEIKAVYKHAQYWCCKSMANVYYLPQIEAGGLHPYYIHLVRDGRDVAASFKNAIVGEKHTYFIAQQWKRDQELASAIANQYGANRVCTLYYEQLIKEPKQALLPVLKMLGLEWSDSILDFYQSEEAKNTAAAGQMWRNVIKPIDPTNLRHYSEKMSAHEILIFETIAGETLKNFGYTLDNELNGSPHTYSTEQVAEFTAINNTLKTEARKKYVADALARVAQEEVVEGVKGRLLGH